MDPLLLSGAVRVALEMVQEESELRLRVPAKDLTIWHSRFEEAHEGAALKLVADEEMATGACVLETSVGSVDLGVAAQLVEIERGFFDLLQQRPG